MDFHLIERLGGSCRAVTLLTFAIHFLHPLFCVTTYLYWLKDQELLLGRPIVTAYLALIVVSCVFYLFLASVFYMWAWRFPEPEEVAKRRRIYGVTVNLLFSDIPLFVVETKIVWQVKFVNGVQGFTYCLTCVSIFYSIVRVWTFFMVKIIKVRAPISTSYPRFSLGRPYNGRNPQYGHAGGGADRAMEYVDNDNFTPNFRSGNDGASYPDDGPSVSRYYYDEGEPRYTPGSGRYSPRSPDSNQRYYYDETPTATRRRL